MKKYQINLLHKNNVSLIEKVIYFLLHYLRYIIVITQIVVISVFFLRFKLDQEIVDLKESVNQKQEIIKVTTPLVEETSMIKIKIGEVKKILQNEEKFSHRLDYIFSIIPEQILLYKLDSDESFIKVDGLSENIESIRLLTARLKKDNLFKDVVINSVTKNDNGYDFFIILTI